MMLSESFSMTQNGARRALRRLELEAYAGVISAFRAQGQFTKDKKASLEVLCKSLGISADRHRAEIRRAVNDELLSLVAIRVSGVDTDRAWRREGQKLCPSHPRFVTHPTAPHAPQVLAASAGAASLSAAVNNLSHAPNNMPLPIQQALRTIMAQNPNKSLRQFPVPSPSPSTRPSQPSVAPKPEPMGAGEGTGAKTGGSGKAYSQLESLLCEENLMQQGDAEEEGKDKPGQTEKPKAAQQQESRKDLVPRPPPGESPVKKEGVLSPVKGQKAGVNQRVATGQGEAKKRSFASSEEPSPAVKKLALDSQGLPCPVTPPRASPQKLLTLLPKTTPPRQSKLQNPQPKKQLISPKQPVLLKLPIPPKQPISLKQPSPPKQPTSPKQPVLAARVSAAKAMTGLPKSTSLPSSVAISPLTTVVASPSTSDPHPPRPAMPTTSVSLTVVSTSSEVASSTTDQPSLTTAPSKTVPSAALTAVSTHSKMTSSITQPLKPPPPLTTPTESPLPPTAPPPEELVPEGADSLIQDLIQDTSDKAVFSLASQLGLGSADSALLDLSDFINIIQPDATDISSPSTPLTLVPPPAPPPFTPTPGKPEPPPLALGHCVTDPPALIDMSATLTPEDTPPLRPLGGGDREEASSESFSQSFLGQAPRPDSLQLPQAKLSSEGVVTTPTSMVVPQATPIDAVLSISTPTDPVLPLTTPTEADKGESGLPSDYLDLDIGSLMGGSGDGSELLQGMPEDVAKSIQTLVQLDQQTWN